MSPCPHDAEALVLVTTPVFAVEGVAIKLISSLVSVVSGLEPIVANLAFHRCVLLYLP